MRKRRFHARHDNKVHLRLPRRDGFAHMGKDAVYMRAPACFFHGSELKGITKDPRVCVAVQHDAIQHQRATEHVFHSCEE